MKSRTAYRVACKASSERVRSPPGVTVAWCALLSCAALVGACVAPGIPGDPPDQFGIVTSQGVVVSSVEGAATGVTNAALTRLIRAGVAEAYPVECAVPADTGWQMVWHVTNIMRKPTVMVDVRVVERGRTVNSAFVKVAAPGFHPHAVFMYDVARLARRVLPPAAGPPTSPPLGCA